MGELSVRSESWIAGIAGAKVFGGSGPARKLCPSSCLLTVLICLLVCDLLFQTLSTPLSFATRIECQTNRISLLTLIVNFGYPS